MYIYTFKYMLILLLLDFSVLGIIFDFTTVNQGHTYHNINCIFLFGNTSTWNKIRSNSFLRILDWDMRIAPSSHLHPLPPCTHSSPCPPSPNIVTSNIY